MLNWWFQSSQNKIAVSLQEISDTLKSIDKTASKIQKNLQKIAGVKSPGLVKIKMEGEMADRIQFKVVLPGTPENSDIVSGELTVDIAGEVKVYKTEKGQTEVAELEGVQGAKGKASFVFVDDQGNKSVNPSEVEFELTDTIPPPDAGTLGVILTGETSV